jgi:two-component system, OmpR family, response regulator
MINVCLIDDDNFIGKMLGLVFKKQGYQFQFFQNGYDAIDDFSKNDYDVVLLDIMMPEIDGFSVFEELKVRRPEIPVIFISANKFNENFEYARERGAYAYITKPFNIDHLIKTMKLAIKSKVDDGHVV